MARKPRTFGITGLYHIILRGNNKQNLFIDSADKIFFIKKMKKYTMELGIEVHAYCLMNNHVHILIGNADQNMSLLVQKIANSYVFYFNRKYDRCGHLFQGRFKSEPIPDDKYYMTVYRYIIQNCEKAGLGSAEHYKWNSYIAFINSKNNSFIKTNYIINLFGSKEAVLKFLNQQEVSKCMEFENKFFLTDEKAFTFIKKIFGITSPYKLERLSIDEQIQKCSTLKKNGISINQISRLTGISRSIIKKS
ncbi:transposase [Treponema sp.]|uniref:transposase n=1 Tax=Treponema sp. TaxID=166 RepID=UPI00388DC087